MARLHPTLDLSTHYSTGAQRERDVLEQLQQGLGDGFDVFHSLEWTNYLHDRQQIGEIDITVVTPAGVLVLIEVKAGGMLEIDGELQKSYGGSNPRVKNINSQVRRQHTAIVARLQMEKMPQVEVESFLVLPDYQVQSATLGYVSQRIIDVTNMASLCDEIARLTPRKVVPRSQRERLLHFLGDKFQVLPDVSTRIGHVKKLSRAMAAGLATWVPQMQHASGHYMVHATAGAGKTQLALRLLRDAALQQRRCAYICFNRALADHLSVLIDGNAEVFTLDQLCVALARQSGVAPDFSSTNAFALLRERMVAAPATERWDFLVVDEIQDLAPAWVEALRRFVAPGGAMYMLGDENQNLYTRGAHHWPDAVHIRSDDNFRSPRKVVDCINLLGLCDAPVQARSPYSGDMPQFYTYDAQHPDAALGQVAACVQRLRADGVATADMAVISYSGKERSQVLTQSHIAGVALNKATGAYGADQKAVWTGGDLLVDTLYRFKGQSAPVVILCEVDFEVLDDNARKRLFVAFTRAQYRLVVVMSTRAESALMGSMA